MREFPQPLPRGRQGVSFLGKLDSGSLKIKVASSIVAISSIHLPQVFLNAPHFIDSQFMWRTLIHLAFVLSARLLGFLERIMTALMIGG